MKTLSLRRWHKGKILCVSVAVLALTLAAPAGAITWGEKDTTGQYPNVGTMILSGPSPFGVQIKCSGTLIHERAVLTAAHCTVQVSAFLASGLVDNVYVSFDFVPLSAPENWLEVESILTNPAFSFTPLSHDNGVLVLKAPVVGITPAQLPQDGFLDELRADGMLGHGTNGAKVTVVGYGASLSFPPPRMFREKVRQFVESEFRALLPMWLRMSTQGKTGDGGACLGDSGGPAFWEEEAGGTRDPRGDENVG